MMSESIVPLNLFGNSNVQRKLEYLDKLTMMYNTIQTSGVQSDIAKRIQSLCDSIEKDLGISDKAFSFVGDAFKDNIEKIAKLVADAVEHALRSKPHTVGYVKASEEEAIIPVKDLKEHVRLNRGGIVDGKTLIVGE